MPSNVTNVEAIMHEIRSGLEDTVLSEATASAAADSSLQSDLRQVAESATVLGRCGGSLRGRLCRLLAKPARPVVEQLDLFHSAVCATLGKLTEGHKTQQVTDRKIAELEHRLQALETQQPTVRHEDER